MRPGSPLFFINTANDQSTFKKIGMGETGRYLLVGYDAHAACQQQQNQ